VVLI
jgi:transposase